MKHTQFIAIDWSGKESGAAESIWLAQVSDRTITTLENGRSRSNVIDWVSELAESFERTFVGLDFAFSFPQWYLDERGWVGGRDVWSALSHEADDILRAWASPFWGRPGRGRDHGREPFRVTEREIGGAPKSVFQIGGAGAVGTGSLRGMPELARLADKEDVSIWPFDEPRRTQVIEIYPRLLTRQVVKGRHRCRLEYLNREFPQQPGEMRERAAGSEDAFDAAVSALVMAACAAELEELSAAPPGSVYAREGRIWEPSQ